MEQIIKFRSEFDDENKMVTVFMESNVTSMTPNGGIRHACYSFPRYQLKESEVCKLILQLVNILLAETFYKEFEEQEGVHEPIPTFKLIDDEEIGKTLNKLCEELKSNMLSKS